MPPLPPVEIDPDVRDQNAADEKACGERIEYALKKYGCMLDGTAVVRNGFTQIQIAIVKIPPELRRQMKEAQKNGQPTAPAAEPTVDPPAPAASA